MATRKRIVQLAVQRNTMTKADLSKAVKDLEDAGCVVILLEHSQAATSIPRVQEI